MTYPAFLHTQPAAALPPLEHAFGQLVQVVADLRRDGRSTHSAGIKPRLAQRLGIPFDEKSYGFATFREFLVAAQRAGIIEIWPATSGPDVTVGLPGQPPDSGRRAPVQIRQDFWATFMDWTPGFERAYDRDQGRAFRVSVAAESYDPQVRQLRQAMQADRTRFVPIEPITMATQTDWARSFAAGRSAGERDDLAQALRADRPLQEFTRKIRALPCLQDWAVFRNERVAEAINAWARQHQLAIDPLAPARKGREPIAAELAVYGVSGHTYPPSSGGQPTRTAPRSGARQRTAPDVNLVALRTRAHELIECMTAEELLALPLNLGMLYRG